VPISVDPDRIQLRPGQFICTPLFDPEKRVVRGLYRPGSTSMKHSTAVVKILRLGPMAQISGPFDRHFPYPVDLEPAMALAPHFKSPEDARSAGAEWGRSHQETPWPFKVGEAVLTSRDFAMVIVWPKTGPQASTYAIGELIFVQAVLEGSHEQISKTFEVVLPADPYGRG